MFVDKLCPVLDLSPRDERLTQLGAQLAPPRRYPRDRSRRRKRQRQHRSPEGKAELLKRHHIEQEAVSTLCEAAGLQPSVFYGWQRDRPTQRLPTRHTHVPTPSMRRI